MTKVGVKKHPLIYHQRLLFKFRYKTDGTICIPIDNDIAGYIYCLITLVCRVLNCNYYFNTTFNKWCFKI